MIIVITYPIVYRSTYICATHVYMCVYVGCTSCEMHTCVRVRACMHLGGCVHARILRVGERSSARGYAHQYMRVYKTDKAIAFI